jgi:hypothetical protein
MQNCEYSVYSCVNFSADIAPGVDGAVCAADPLPAGGGTHQPDHQPQAAHHHFQFWVSKNYQYKTMSFHFQNNYFCHAIISTINV